MTIMKKWPEWAWVMRHAESARNDTLCISSVHINHVFPHIGDVSYCSRSWGPQEYIAYREKMLKDMAEDVERLKQLFTVSDDQTIGSRVLTLED